MKNLRFSKHLHGYFLETTAYKIRTLL